MVLAGWAGASSVMLSGVHRRGWLWETIPRRFWVQDTSQDHPIPIRSLSLLYKAITFPLFLTLVYNLIVVCPDFASLQTYIPNPSPRPYLLPSNLYFILLQITLPEDCFSQKLSMVSYSLHFLSWHSGTSPMPCLEFSLSAHTIAKMQHTTQQPPPGACRS